MDETIKAQWVAALRSGEYEQAADGLHIGDQFCCLGVLCDLAVKAGVDVGVAIDEYVEVDGQPWFVYDDEGGALPPSVWQWAGLDSAEWPENPVIRANGEDRSLATLNDDGVPFTKIADLIEKHL